MLFKSDSEVNILCQEAASDEGVSDRFALDLRARNASESTTTGKTTPFTNLKQHE